MTIATRARCGLALAVLAAAGLAVFGCSEKKEKTETAMPATKPPANQAEVRDFTAAELDTLRAMKKRNGVTRDEYWNDRGGVLANDVVAVWYPPGKLTVSHGMYALDHMMQSRAKIRETVGRVPDDSLTVVCSQTMEAYTQATGRQWWHYSRIDDDRITYQPIPVLVARGLLDIALPREYYEWAIGRVSKGRAPRWMVEGFASVLSDEGTVLEDNLVEFPDDPLKMETADVEQALTADTDRKRARIAAYNAYRMVDRIVDRYGREKLVATILAIADGQRPAEAAEAVFGTSYDELLADARGWEREVGE